MRCAGGNRMYDIPIRWSAESGAGDWSPDSAEVSDLQIAVMISLFTERQARPDDVIPDGSTDARGWWGKPNIVGPRLAVGEQANHHRYLQIADLRAVRRPVARARFGCPADRNIVHAITTSAPHESTRSRSAPTSCAAIRVNGGSVQTS